MEEIKRKRGRPRKVQEVIEREEERQEREEVLTAEPIEVVQDVVTPEPVRFVEKPPMTESERIVDSRALLNERLGPDQKLFESPEGELFIGPADKDQIWSRHMNHGHGGWVNPRR